MAVFLMAMACTAAGAVIYVDDDASVGGNGQTWATPYRYLQDALTAAISGDEIRVAHGIYKPDEDSAHPNGTGSRTATFRLKNGVAVKGGYAGSGEPDPDARDVEVYETILSGDLNGDDVGFTNNGENSLHVVTGSGTDATAVLDGFTITAGNANQDYPSPYANGGGMYNYTGSPTLTNCTFSENSARYDGGGIYNRGSSPTLTNCIITGNKADTGGGMDNWQSSPTLTNCIFSGNSAETGGGMCNWENSSPTVTNCTFTGNSAVTYGGGMSNFDHSSPTVTNCTFSGNTANRGGGMSNDNNSSPTVTNCTFSGNSAGWDGGGTFNYYSSPTLANCILWGNAAPTGPQIHNYGTSSATVSYSDVQGGWPGIGNINADPRFVRLGYWVVPPPGHPGGPFWVEGNYHLLPDSPCIDAGTNTPPGGLPTTDMDGKPRVIGGRIDMGPYEFNHIPVADAGPDQTFEAQAPWGATVTLDGSGSSDADSIPPLNNDINDFDWYKVDPCDPDIEDFLGSGEIIDCNLPFGEHIIILEVVDKAGASDIDELTVIVQDTTPPVFTNIPQDLTVECDGNYNVAELNAWLAGVTAVDKCGDVTITNDFVGILNECGATGSATVTWTAEDESGNTATTPSATFTIVDTTLPVITCPANVTLECPADISVEANGSATAGDVCGTVTVTHSDQWQAGCGNTGTLTRTWTATDECGNSSSCVQTITVVDTTPPEFSLSVSPTVLWPANHKMVLITPTWTVSDICDDSPEVSLVSITMNEYDEATGSGHTTDDIQIGDDGSIYLRAERSGKGNDRVYTITYRAVDDCGNATESSATVTVPHDQR